MASFWTTGLQLTTAQALRVADSLTQDEAKVLCQTYSRGPSVLHDISTAQNNYGLYFFQSSVALATRMVFSATDMAQRGISDGIVAKFAAGLEPPVAPTNVPDHVFWTGPYPLPVTGSRVRLAQRLQPRHVHYLAVACEVWPAAMSGIFQHPFPFLQLCNEASHKLPDMSAPALRAMGVPEHIINDIAEAVLAPRMVQPPQWAVAATPVVPATSVVSAPVVPATSVATTAVTTASVRCGGHYALPEVSAAAMAPVSVSTPVISVAPASPHVAVVPAGVGIKPFVEPKDEESTDSTNPDIECALCMERVTKVVLLCGHLTCVQCSRTDVCAVCGQAAPREHRRVIYR